MKRALLITLLFASAHFAMGEENRRIPTVSAQYIYGLVAKTNDFADGVNLSQEKLRNFNSVQLTLALQTTGKHDWEHIHNFPQMGIGIGMSRFNNTRELGKPFSVFAFYNGTFWRNANNVLRYNIGLGVATNWTPYNSETNPYNLAIGSKTTAHIELGVDYAHTLADRWEVGAGVGFMHFSNGKTRTPNKGLNILTPRIRVAYLFRENKLPARRLDIDRPTGNELQLAVGFGVFTPNYEDVEGMEANPYPHGIHFYTTTLQSTFLHRYGHRGKFGGSLQLFYNNEYGSSPTINGTDVHVHLADFEKRFAVGLFAAHEFIIDRMSIVTQVGVASETAVWRPRDYERLGLRYVFWDNMFAGVSVFAHKFSESEFIEWCIGYNIPLKKNKNGRT